MYGYRISLICIIQTFGAKMFLIFSVIRYFHIVFSCGYDHYWVDILIVCKGIESFQFGYGIWASMLFFSYFSTNKLR
jgi:hypothetical protein